MAATLMTFKYGNHTHDAGEVNMVRFELLPEFSPNGRRMFTRYRMHVMGELIANGQSAINAKIGTLISAYAENFKDAGLYHTDGTPTKHVLDSDHQQNMSGNRVAYRSWPRGGADEYATVRTFYIVVEALFRDPDSGLVVWREQVNTRGTAGATWELVGGIKYDKTLLSNQRIYQFGYAEGLTVYPAGNVPAPLVPDWEHQELREFNQHDATYFGQRYGRFGLSWGYHMESPTGQSITPNLGF